MGNSNRSISKDQDVDLWWKSTQQQPENVSANTSASGVHGQTSSSATSDVTGRTILSDKSVHDHVKDAPKRQKDNFAKEISSLHEKRLQIIAEKKKEFDRMRQDLVSEKVENERLRLLLKANGIAVESTSSGSVADYKDEHTLNNLDRSSLDFLKISKLTEENEKLKSRVLELESMESRDSKASEENGRLQREIARLQSEIQGMSAEMEAFERERQEYNTHVTALKDIIKVSKQLLEIRQNQITQLNDKLEQIQNTAAEREMTAYSDDLRQEYERQLRNIKDLRTLYEERQAAADAAKEKFKKELEECQKELQQEKAKTSELTDRVQELEGDNSEKYDKIANLELNANIKKAECNELQAQLSVINQLFSEIILGFRNGHEIDMDKLIDVLEQNHDLLTDIVVNEESNEVSSTLPKVLLDLINQVKESESKKQDGNVYQEHNGEQQQVAPEETKNSTPSQSMYSAAEIVQNLPKVWRVLAELLSHQQIPVNNLTGEDAQSENDPCYKSIQTPTGPRLVLSVSGTFIRLKDLILEKKSLEKETFHLKQLNTHLESRLQDQEKRLEVVSEELSKTWHVVGKMQKQHQHLHTQEKILRYELAQKRKLLTELKEELEYCREKWLKAREKNNKTEMEWKELRDEFASRKRTLNDDLNNSVESGYSDERENSSDDDIFEIDASVSPVVMKEENETKKQIELLALPPTEVIVDEGNEDNETPISLTPSNTNDSIPEVINNEIASIQDISMAGPEASSSITTDTDLEVDKVETHSNANVTEKADSVGLSECSDTSCLCKSGLNNLPDTNLKNRQAEIEETYKRLESDILMTVAKAQKGESFNLSASNSKTVPPVQNLKRENIKLFPSPLDEVTLAKPQKCEWICDNSSTSTDIPQSSEETSPVPEASSSRSREGRTPSEILADREERLKQLEDQCKQLTFKILSNSYRGCQMYRKLTDLHEKHGSTSSTNEPTSNSSTDNEEEEE